MPPKANPVNWFEIPVNDMQRAIQFYEKVFGLPFTSAVVGPNQLAFFPMDTAAYGAGGALVMGKGSIPSHQGTTVYFSVENIDPMLERITKAGGKTLIPRTSIGQYGFFAQFEDSEGNRVALHEMPKQS